MTKRLLASLLAILTIVVVAPVFVTKTSAAKTEINYDVTSAINYAEKNWNNGRGLCAQFASECLNAGGVSAYGLKVEDLYNALIDGEYGKSYKLTLTNGKSGSLKMSDNVGKVEKGDPIFYFCNVCKTYEHVVICNGVNSKGYIQDFAHNKAHNGKKQTYTFSHCGTDNWTFYSVRIDDEKMILTPEINSLVNTKNGVELKWNDIKKATYYRVYRRLPGGSWLFLKNVTDNSYVDTTAENGKTYIYTVRACEGSLWSNFKESAKWKFLSQVDFKSANVTNNGIKITWNKNDAVSAYAIYRSVNNGKWVRYATVTGAAKTYYLDTAVENGKTYCYRIRGISGSALTSFDYNGIKTTFVATPGIRSGVNAVDGVIFNWGSVKGATGYRVYRKAAGEKTWTYLGTMESNSYKDTNVKNNAYYRYTVRAVYDGVFSGYDAEGVLVKHIKTPELKSVETVEDGIKLEWEAIEGVSGYYVYHKAEGDAHWTRIAVVKDGESYVDTDVEEGVEYTYTVKAFFGNRMSAYDAEGLVCKFIPRKPEQDLPEPESDPEPEIE